MGRNAMLEALGILVVNATSKRNQIKERGLTIIKNQKTSGVTIIMPSDMRTREMVKKVMNNQEEIDAFKSDSLEHKMEL